MTSAYLRLLGLHLLAVVSAGQNILCCDNAVYSFTIDLARTCEDSNVSGPYIDDTLTTCILTTLPPFFDEGFFLEKITKVDVYEMSPTQSVIAKETLTTPLMDGTVFAYVSIVGLSGGVKVPNSLQVVATAETSTGASVINLWSVTYTDECILPAFSSGGEIGWMQVSLSCDDGLFGGIDGGDTDGGGSDGGEIDGGEDDDDGNKGKGKGKRRKHNN